MIDRSINPHIDRIAMRLKTIPENPGVYQHLDASGKVIYVGKARNLQRRVSSYFTHYDEKSPKIQMLVRNIYDTRVTVVASEVDALLLENSLIKQYQPRYNSMLKDDKSYPYLVITDEPYPRLLFTRKQGLRGQYFGPYPNGRILRELQGIIRQLFRYRTCDRMANRPCMKHQIGLCDAPCAGLQSQDDYRAVFDNIRRILQGDFGEIKEQMVQQMSTAAADLRFEEAEQWKRKIKLLEEYQSRSTVVGANVRDVDVVGIASDEQYAYISMMRVKQGAIIYSYTGEVKKLLEESDAEILATVVPTMHQQTASTAHEVVLPIAVADLPADYLTQTTAPRGDRRKLLDLAMRNAESYQKQCKHQRALVEGEAAPSALKLLERIQKMLDLPTLPMNIECFDNSNIQGAYPVAGMVRFTAGKPNRSEYRKFNIKTVEGPDDYGSMAEVIERRYRRLHDEGKPLPDLLIVDGGAGQMQVARHTIEETLGLHIPIAGLAKDDHHRTRELLLMESHTRKSHPTTPTRTGSEADYSEGDIRHIGLRPTDPLFHLMERIQDEVHRFAITFHKDKRSKGTFRTSLTDIPGIGPRTAQQLLLHYGSVKRIAIASRDDIAQLIGPAKADAVYNYLNTNLTK